MKKQRHFEKILLELKEAFLARRIKEDKMKYMLITTRILERQILERILGPIEQISNDGPRNKRNNGRSRNDQAREVKHV